MIVDLSLRELEILVEFHKNKQWDESKKECYLDAEFHKSRAEELIKVMNAA